MKTRFFIMVGLVLGSAGIAHAVEGVYVGGQVGHVALIGDKPYVNNIGFGFDLGVRTNPVLDLVARYHRSSHGPSPNLEINAATISAEYHFWEVNDFDFSAGVGPGFYFFNVGGGTESKFGLNFGLNTDVVIDDSFRVGLGWRYHAAFGASSSTGANFWTIMMRVGYLFRAG